MSTHTTDGKNNILKLVFGIAIFLFSLALAYFSARYIGKRFGITDSGVSNNDMYWLTLAIAAIFYIIAGILVSSVYPISFGFLFSADVLILHLFFENFAGWKDIWKALITASLLCVMYAAAQYKFPDEPETAPSPVPDAPKM